MKIRLWIWINKFNQSLAEDEEGRIIVYKTFRKGKNAGKKFGKRGIDTKLWKLEYFDVCI